MPIDPRMVKWEEPAPAKAVIDPRMVKWEESPTTMEAGTVLNDIPRQLGLTARYGLEGLANTAQIFTEPVRRLVTDPLLRATGALPSGKPTLSGTVAGQEPAGESKSLGQAATELADWMGLPSPRTANERVIGDAARLVAGAGGGAGLAQLAANQIPRAAATAAQQAPGILSRGQAVAQGLAANVPSQLGSAAGAGLAEGASREAGGSEGTRLLASVAGGLLGGAVPSMADKAVTVGKQLLTPKIPDSQVDLRLTELLQPSGITLSDLSMGARTALRQDMRKAMKTGDQISPEALSRLATFRAAGLTPTRGAISQNPVDITREQNLSKMAANSADEGLSGLPLIQNRNNARLIQNLNDLGAGTQTEPVAAGRELVGAVQARQAALRAQERSAWDAARSSPGYTQPIYPDGLNAINRALGDEGMMPFMNPTISRYMEAFQTGQQPFTPQAYRNLQSMLANELNQGGNAAAAARIARNALEASPMRPITNPGGIDLGTLPVTGEVASGLRAFDAQAGQAIDAVNRARGATRAAYAYEESSPLVRSVLSEGSTSDPTRIAQRFVIGGTPDEAATVAREAGPAARQVIRDALITDIKRKALSGASDETGKISQSSLRAAINKIGEEKLRLFFTADEITALRNNSRAASLIQSQPVGSAVNNSNSGAMLAGMVYDTIKGLADKLPAGKTFVTDPLRNWETTIRTRQAQNVIPGLLAPTAPAAPTGAGLLLPAVAVSGGLLAP